MYKRGMVVVIICLFIGANVASSISSDIKQFDTDVEEENINFLGSTSGIKIYKFNPTDDAYICKSESNKNFGENENIKIRSASSLENSAFYQIDGLVKFDIFSKIPSDENILSATLNLYYYRGEYSPSGRDLNLYNVTSDWSEDKVTWDEQPSYAFLPTSYSTIPKTIEEWMPWKVTNDVQYYFDEPSNNYGWKITDETPVDSLDIPVTYFCSKQHGDNDNIPYLEIKTVKADIYVDINNTEGPWNGTIDHPYQHIQDGIDNAIDGNTVFVFRGEYYENLLINKSINLIGEHRNVTVIHGVANIESDGVTIEGFTLEGGCIELHKRSNIAFYNNTFLCNNSYNFDISYSHDITIKKCNISNMGGKEANIHLDAAKHVLIHNNKFVNSGVSEGGIKIYYSENNTISKNNFRDHYRNIIHMESSKFCNILENQFFSDSNPNYICSLMSIEGCNNNTIKGNSLSYIPNISENMKNFNINYFITVKNSNFNWILNNTLIGSVNITDNKNPFYLPRFFWDNAKYFFTHIILKNYEAPESKSLGYGIRLVSSNGNKVKGNDITGLKVGISVAQSKGNIISRNIVSFCYQFGLHLSTTTFNLFAYNQFYKNYVSVYIEKAYMDSITLNDFIYGGDIAQSPNFQFFSSFTTGSSVVGWFNYWENPVGFTRVWGIPWSFFLPPLFKSIKEDSVLLSIGEKRLEKSPTWWDEVRDGLV